MRRLYRQMHFFKRVASNPKVQIQNVIMDQNKWLRIMQQEQPFF